MLVCVQDKVSPSQIVDEVKIHDSARESEVSSTSEVLHKPHHQRRRCSRVCVGTVVLVMVEDGLRQSLSLVGGQEPEPDLQDAT